MRAWSPRSFSSRSTASCLRACSAAVNVGRSTSSSGILVLTCEAGLLRRAGPVSVTADPPANAKINRQGYLGKRCGGPAANDLDIVRRQASQGHGFPVSGWSTTRSTCDCRSPTYCSSHHPVRFSARRPLACIGYDGFATRNRPALVRRTLSNSPRQEGEARESFRVCVLLSRRHLAQSNMAKESLAVL
jgi:hypothetical protein